MKYVKICIEVEPKKFEIYENVIAGTIKNSEGKNKIAIPDGLNSFQIINDAWKGEWEFGNYEIFMSIENNPHIREFLISENIKFTTECY